MKTTNINSFNNFQNYVSSIKGSFLYHIIIILIFNFFQNLYLARFSLEQNIYDRFHTPSLSIAISFFGYFLIILVSQKDQFINIKESIKEIKSFFKSLFKIQKIIIINFLIFFLANTPYNFLYSLYGSYRYILEPYRSNIVSLSKDLNAINEKENISKMIVTEAGRLSYYSGIKTVDAWGLNTKKYSKIPLNSVSKVIQENPCIINAHINFSKLPGGEIEPYEDKRSWLNMTLALYRGALSNHDIRCATL